MLFENDEPRTVHKKYFVPTVEIKDYNVRIDGKKFFDQPIRNDMRIYDYVRKIAIGPGDDHTTGCLIDYLYFKKSYRLIATDLIKKQVLDADAKAIQQIHFTGKLDCAVNTTIFFIKKIKKMFCIFHRELC